MTHGLNRILKIRLFGKPVKVATTNSGNTCGARYWTDGKMEAPMWPDNPLLRVHPGTGEIFWIDQCRNVGWERPGERRGKYARIPFAKDPGLDDYRRALNGKWGDTPKNRSYLLLRFWWAANDPCRRGELTADRPPDFREKLLEFLSLMNPDNPDERLLMAEMRRQLGDFAAANHHLERDVPEPCSRHRRLIRQWNDRNDIFVREVRELGETCAKTIFINCEQP